MKKIQKFYALAMEEVKSLIKRFTKQDDNDIFNHPFVIL